MKRGMVTLSSSQLDLIQSLIPTMSHLPPELPTRVTAAQKAVINANSSQTELELSEDSAEAVLDSLPMPQPNENQVITATRISFQQFLSSLRNTITSVQ
jgi:hypothetical protein